MRNGRKVLTAVLGLAIVAVASPALAEQNQNNNGEPYNEGFPIGVVRAAAIRECSLREAKFLDRLWGVTEVSIYRACMAGHGQIE